MGRARRIDVAGAWHHVMNRGSGRRVVFRDRDDRHRFLELVGALPDRFHVEVHAYCLMGNHFHLLVRSLDGQLSDAMKWVTMRFTREVNADRCVDGAIFRGRFRSLLIERESHLVWLFRYINANPLDLGWNGPLSAYPWSGLARTIERTTTPDWLSTDFAHDRFGSGGESLERFVERARTPPSPAGRVGATPEEVRAAADLARIAGEIVHSDSDLRTVAAVVHVDRCGLGIERLAENLDLSDEAARDFLRRARRRVAERPALAAYVARTLDVLTVDAESIGRPPSLSA